MSTVIVTILYAFFIRYTLSSRRQLRVWVKLLSAVESRRDGLNRERAGFQPSLTELVRFVGLPRTVDLGGFGGLHAPFFTEGRTRGRVQVQRGPKSGYAPVGMTIHLGNYS